MPDYALSMVELIDSRVDHSQPALTHFGTVAGRSTGSLDADGAYWANVIFDGSDGTSVPVKCFATVLILPGDRVGLVKFGADWIIVGNYTARVLGDKQLQQQLANGNTTIASYADLPGSPQLVMTKLRDETGLRVSINMAAYAS